MNDTTKTVSLKQDEKNSARIMAIRAAAGNPNTHCPTCGHTRAAPFRSIVSGRIEAGCIDASHTGQLDTSGGQWNDLRSVDWHNRQVARNLRADALKSLTR